MQNNKEIIYNKEAREKLKQGVDIVANAVKITLGPRGKNVALQNEYSTLPKITNDGVSIARSIKVKDNFVNMGVEIAKDTALKTDKLAGDGTTTTIILLQEIIKNGLDKINNGVNVIKLNHGIQKMAHDIILNLNKKAKKIETLEELKQVAMISVENKDLAILVAETIWDTGLNGKVSVIESDGNSVKAEKINGYRINNGFANEYVINNPYKMSGEYDNIPVLITDKKIFNYDAFISEKGDGIIKRLADNGHKVLLLIADDIDGPALQTFYINATRNIFTVIPIRFSTFGEGRLEELKDIATFCNTQIIGDKSGIELTSSLNLDYLGSIDHIETTIDSTLLYGGTDTSTRINDLEELLKNTEEEASKMTIKNRIANLSSKVAIIKVGAQTDTERTYIKLKVDDAVNSCVGALEMGVVEGGGFALYEEYLKLRDTVLATDGDEQTGERILLESINAPYIQLLENCGIKFSQDNKQRYNAEDNTFTDVSLVKLGIIDPVKVTITALLNAASSAGTLLTTDVLIVNEYENK